ncbi:MAG TPA: ketoacyl-ACP synthase III [Nannocystaceae bacterium]|nr:ketoacyl-ACP synthase III [Nannocystaceae bacterium]
MKIAGMAASVPKNKVRTDSAYDKFTQFEVDRIIGNTGVKEKREAEPGTTSVDLCIAAAKPLIEKLDWDPKTIDAVILVTVLSDHIMPASSHRAHAALGLDPRCLVFDVNLGCSGWTHGMIMLDSMISSGLIKRGLLLCGEMTSATFRQRITEVQHRADLPTAILFGDAGSATAVTHDDEQQVKAVQFGADGTGFGEIIVPGGGARQFWSPELFERKPDAEGEERRALDLVLRGPQVLTFTMKRVPPLLNDLLEKSGWSRDDVDSYVLHQANKFMIDFLVKRMKVPSEKVPLSMDEFGNTSSASIPLTMVTRCAEQLGRPTKWCAMGFGVGLSWSGLMLQTDAVATLPLVEV